MTHTRHSWYTLSAWVSVLLFELAMYMPNDSFLMYAIAHCAVEGYGVVQTLRMVREALNLRTTLAKVILERERRRKARSNR